MIPEQTPPPAPARLSPGVVLCLVPAVLSMFVPAVGRTLDAESVALDSLRYSAPAFLAVLLAAAAAARRAEGREERSTRLVAGLILAAGLCLLGITTEIRLNQTLDAAPGALHLATVVKTETLGKTRRVYLLHSFKSWRPDRAFITVRDSIFSGNGPGSVLLVESKPGRFGFEWIASWRAATAEEKARYGANAGAR